jgi:hypothetical protein
MKTIQKSKIYDAESDAVFRTLDDLGVTGSHMTQSSAMMMGSKLNLAYLTGNHTGPGTKYRWTGTMMGLSMDFTVEVTLWIDGKEKTWETIGKCKMIIYSWYRMHLILTPMREKTKADLSISYEKPEGVFNKIISFFFADWYCRWCLTKMLNDCRKELLKGISTEYNLSHGG